MEYKVRVRFGKKGEREQQAVVTVTADIPEVARVAALLAFRHLEGNTSHVIDSKVIG
jgi:hypothetical protein